MSKKLALALCLIGIVVLFAGCGEVALSTTEVNQVELPDGPEDLKKLGEALNGKSGIKVAVNAPEASYILDSLASLGEVKTEDFSLELNLNGSGNWANLAALSSVRGLSTLILSGSYDLDDLEPLTSLEGLAHLQISGAPVTKLTPLAAMNSLNSLYLDLDHYDFETLLKLDIGDIEIPMRDTIWIAMELLKENPALETVNGMTTETFSSKEYLEGEDEKIYYYNQFVHVFYLNNAMRKLKAGEFKAAPAGEKPVLTGTAILASPEGLLQTVPYREQDMLATASGYSEGDGATVYFPYIKRYDGSAEDVGLVRFAGTAFMEEKFLVAVSEEDAETVIFYYTYTDTEKKEENGDASPKRQPVVQILNLREGIVYDPVPTPPIDASLSGEALQKACIDALDAYLKGLTAVE